MNASIYSILSLEDSAAGGADCAAAVAASEPMVRTVLRKTLLVITVGDRLRKPCRTLDEGMTVPSGDPSKGIMHYVLSVVITYFNVFSILLTHTVFQKITADCPKSRSS